MNLGKEDFILYINDLVENMDNECVDINSGDVHRALGNYPGKNHRMPSCCLAMKDIMIIGDIILEEPNKGLGANLTIRYFKRH